MKNPITSYKELVRAHREMFARTPAKVRSDAACVIEEAMQEPGMTPDCPDNIKAQFIAACLYSKGLLK